MLSTKSTAMGKTDDMALVSGIDKQCRCQDPSRRLAKLTIPYPSYEHDLVLPEVSQSVVSSLWLSPNPGRIDGWETSCRRHCLVQLYEDREASIGEMCGVIYGAEGTVTILELLIHCVCVVSHEEPEVTRDRHVPASGPPTKSVCGLQ